MPVEAHPSELVQIDKRFIPGLFLIHNFCFTVNLRNCAWGTDVKCHPPSFYLFIYLFIYLWLCWVFVAVGAFFQLQQVRVTLGCNMLASHCSSFCGCRALALGVWASVVVVHGLSCPDEYGIFLDEGCNWCLLRWQVDSLSLSHKGSPQFLSF